jgi:hypothetical protein
MATGQFPQRRETPGQAQKRVAKLQERAKLTGYSYPVKEPKPIEERHNRDISGGGEVARSTD